MLTKVKIDTGWYAYTFNKKAPTTFGIDGTWHHKKMLDNGIHKRVKEYLADYIKDTPWIDKKFISIVNTPEKAYSLAKSHTTALNFTFKTDGSITWKEVLDKAKTMSQDLKNYEGIQNESFS